MSLIQLKNLESVNSSITMGPTQKVSLLTIRKNRWKHMRNLFLIISKPPFDKCSFENALVAHAHNFMTLEQFVMRMVYEFKFPPKMKMDEYARWLYQSFDECQENNVDWREMLLYYKVLRYFRFVRDRPLDLLLLLFDVYGEGGDCGEGSERSAMIDKDRIVLHSAKSHLTTIFTVPCLSETELYGMETMLEGLLDYLDLRNNRIARRELEQNYRNGTFSIRAVNYWATLAWQQLLPDQRLTILDEAQLQHAYAADVIISRYQNQQALVIFTKNTKKHFFRAWKIQTIKASGARAFASKRLELRAKRWLCRWQRIARRYALYRRKRLLAQVMGDYAIKARCFQRILKHNSSLHRITRIAGCLLPESKRLLLALGHLREVRRLYTQRCGLYRWFGICRLWRFNENAIRHYKHHLLRMVLNPWFTWAHARATEKRQEIVVRENQLSLHRMLEDAENAAKEIIHIENMRREAQERQEKEKLEREQQERLELARKQALQAKEREKRQLLQAQTVERTLRIRHDMARLKIIFNMEFEFKAQEEMEKTKDRTIAYIENPDNKLSIDLKFEQLKREFHANPTPETREREKMLSSYKNILFLFIDAQLQKEKIELSELYNRYDLNKKGYLTYGEFANMVRSLNTKLNEAQISNVIRHVDADRDGYITLAECEKCMSCVHLMGAAGSSWKLYIDPAEDVICYHNFQTNEKFLEYEITDKELRGINLANLYAEAEFHMTEQLKTIRKEEWSLVLRSYMARRLQYMYRVWKGRQIRKKLVWRILQREQVALTKKMRYCAEFVARYWRGKKARQLFMRQLAFTIEKVYDRNAHLIFYYNHVTKQSVWEKPRLFVIQGPVYNREKERRLELGAMYSAVLTEPCVWVPLEPSEEAELAANAITDATAAEDNYTNANSHTHALDVRMSTSHGDSGSNDREKYESVYDTTAQYYRLQSSANDTTASTALTVPNNYSEDEARASISTALTVGTDGSYDSNQSVHYYHINARRVFPGKPDGFPVCGVCQYQLAVHVCLDCQTSYCFACHRATHANPFGFAQHAKAKRSQYHNPDFVAQLYNFQHRWEVAVPVSCDLCHGRERLFAAWQCVTCENKHFCKKCFVRVHHSNQKLPHSCFRI